MNIPPGLRERFTLIVPTYNRPAELSRLLTYLERHDIGCPVLVMDSSDPANAARNAACVAHVRGDIRLHALDSAVSPWEKFWRAAELVETPYCSLCADDDLVIPHSLPQLVRYLEEHPDYSAAHGWYFTFYDSGHIGITSSVYRGASVEQPHAVQRLYSLFQSYEAVTYAVYRTDVARRVLGAVQAVQSMLARELLGGALTVVAGKTARLPLFYYGRSLAPSQPYVHWHPLDFLVSAPDELWRDYASYRRTLLAAFTRATAGSYTEEDLAILIDLIHLRYFADYVKPRVMDYLVEQKMALRDKAEIMQGLWAVLAGATDASFAGALSGMPWIRRLRDRFFPKIRLHHLKRLLAPTGQRTLKSATASGKEREYLLYQEFLASLEGPGLESEIGGLIAALDRYE